MNASSNKYSSLANILAATEFPSPLEETEFSNKLPTGFRQDTRPFPSPTEVNGGAHNNECFQMFFPSMAFPSPLEVIGVSNRNCSKG